MMRGRKGVVVFRSMMKVNEKRFDPMNTLSVNKMHQTRMLSSAAKKKKKQKTTEIESPPPGEAKEAEQNIYLELLRAQPLKEKKKLTDEEQAKNKVLADNYSRGMWARDRRNQQEIKRRQLLKVNAYMALPSDELRSEADHKRARTVPPFHRQLPYWTPPKVI